MSVSAQDILDALESAILARMTGGAVNAYTINGRNLQYMTLKEMQDFRDRLKREIASGTPGGTTTYASFESPT